MILTLINDLLVAAIFCGALGLLFGVLIAVFAKMFYVQEDTRIEQVTEMLPGYNCGACGFPGCNGLATSIINEGASVDKCRPIKPDQAQKIREFLKSLENSEKVAE